jgi:hypothetical protein
VYPQGLHASDERDRLGNGRTSAHEIEPADAQRGHLSEPDPSVCEKEDDQAVRTARFGE